MPGRKKSNSGGGKSFWRATNCSSSRGCTKSRVWSRARLDSHPRCSPKPISFLPGLTARPPPKAACGRCDHVPEFCQPASPAQSRPSSSPGSGFSSSRRGRGQVGSLVSTCLRRTARYSEAPAGFNVDEKYLCWHLGFTYHL